MIYQLLSMTVSQEIITSMCNEIESYYMQIHGGNMSNLINDVDFVDDFLNRHGNISIAVYHEIELYFGNKAGGYWRSAYDYPLIGHTIVHNGHHHDCYIGIFTWGYYDDYTDFDPDDSGDTDADDTDVDSVIKN